MMKCNDLVGDDSAMPALPAFQKNRSCVTHIIVLSTFVATIVRQSTPVQSSSNSNAVAFTFVS